MHYLARLDLWENFCASLLPQRHFFADVFEGIKILSVVEKCVISEPGLSWRAACRDKPELTMSARQKVGLYGCVSLSGVQMLKGSA